MMIVFISLWRWIGINKTIHGSGLDLERAAFSKFALSSCGLAEDVLAVVAGNDGLGMAEDYCSLVASSALDVHEVGVGSGHEALEFVGLTLLLEGGVEEVSVHLWLIKDY